MIHEVMRIALRAQAVRFLVVGALNTAFSYCVYAALLMVGFGFVTANFGALVLGIFFSFRTQGALVFGNREWRRLARFVPVWGCIFVFNIGIIALLTRAGLNEYLAGAVALLPVTALSFMLQKFFVFPLPGRSLP